MSAHDPNGHGSASGLARRSLNPRLDDLSVSDLNKAHLKGCSVAIEISVRSWATSRLCRLMDRSGAQLGLFGSLEGFPEGFSYEENILCLEEERTLVRAFAGLPLKAFQFQGFQGKRRVMSFGLHYDFNTHGLGSAEAIPDFMMVLRERAAGFAEVSPEALQHVLVTEYAPGAGIGWHSDRPEFGIIVGVSLVAPCHFRLRRKVAPANWKRASLIAQPRSIYLMQGNARHEWQHSIPSVDSLRYSVTFRTLNKSKG